jgi:hypothetical protein
MDGSELMSYGVYIRNPDLWDQKHTTGVSKKEAQNIASDWNRRRGFKERVKRKDATDGQAYVHEGELRE